MNRGIGTGNASTDARSTWEPAAGVATASGAAPSVIGLATRLGWLDGGPLAEPVRWLREEDNVTALHGRSAGRPTRLVGLSWIDGYQGVLALPDAGIGEPAQLHGRRLALPRREPDRAGPDVARAAACRGFDAATGLACLFADEYELTDVAVAPGEAPYAAETAALLRGEVDAIYVAGTAGRAVAERIGAVEVVDLGAHLDPAVRVNATTPRAITVDEKLLRHDPEWAVELLAALLRAGEWAERQPRAIADAYGAGGIEQQFHVDLSAHKLAALEAQHGFLRHHGFLADGEVDIVAWVDPAPLAAARELVLSERA
ncbi:ABC transporter substrate-binding protein [Conexibacter arvalis]|uniref:ABC-type nitrate/sulfonate/bicarbonate transport system substrate-binding protein n=1 Tax=Conexibacter arvalis TaxID=912552 RepID=A0A840IE46_9ACTN|nr:ABC transporter substrate-binding protein [Conexibacter arvalis]MBB4663257.1 ABC-type nitrate/sulfonate/bicarbonate transport system substrate-binding protein [Conexibacter arvalis]